ncbi:unnamed protein product, partial [Didymodactylos carnosus]
SDSQERKKTVHLNQVPFAWHLAFGFDGRDSIRLLPWIELAKMIIYRREMAGTEVYDQFTIVVFGETATDRIETSKGYAGYTTECRKISGVPKDFGNLQLDAYDTIGTGDSTEGTVTPEEALQKLHDASLKI